MGYAKEKWDSSVRLREELLDEAAVVFSRKKTFSLISINKGKDDQT